MEAVQGLSLWFGAAVAGSAVGTALLHVALQGGRTELDLQDSLGLGVMTLIWTAPGSALLTLVFAWTGGRGIPLPRRHGVLLALGAAAGGTLMVPFHAFGPGVVYGTTTAIGWSLLHRVLCGAAKAS